MSEYDLEKSLIQAEEDRDEIMRAFRSFIADVERAAAGSEVEATLRASIAAAKRVVEGFTTNGKNDE